MATRAHLRLDVWLVERGLAESRAKAQALIMAGRARIDGQPVTKAGAAVREDAVVELLPGPQHVGRGALKLAGALDVLAVNPAGRIAVDVGASTGGFTEVLLSRGALRVYAVDVGRAQLHESLRRDTRVHLVAGVNARYLSPSEIPEPCQLATMDVSFISVLKLLPALRTVLTPEADIVLLVKPQFELTRRDVGRGGLVLDPELHRRALAGVAHSAHEQLDYAVVNACASPISGAEGNREFFLHIRPSGDSLPAERWESMITSATQALDT